MPYITKLCAFKYLYLFLCNWWIFANPVTSYDISPYPSMYLEIISKSKLDVCIAKSLGFSSTVL